MAVRLVNPGKLLAPQKCIICENGPNMKMRVVDTGNHFNSVPVRHPLRGRKYVCSDCGDRIARALAYMPLSKSAEFEDTVARQKARIEDLEEQVNLQDVVERLAAVVQIKGPASLATRTGGVGEAAEVTEE